jgi:hypothetical protein
VQTCAVNCLRQTASRQFSVPFNGMMRLVTSGRDVGLGQTGSGNSVCLRGEASVAPPLKSSRTKTTLSSSNRISMSHTVAGGMILPWRESQGELCAALEAAPFGEAGNRSVTLEDAAHSNGGFVGRSEWKRWKTTASLEV